MLFVKEWWKNLRRLTLSLLFLVLVVNLWGCSDRIETSSNINSDPVPRPTARLKQLKEVAPPNTIQQLHQILELKQPQVRILSPQPEQILTDNQVSIQLQVTDLPVFQDKELQLGSHLTVILDNQDPQDVYDLQQPLVFSDLAAGSHTLRVFAAYPWHESFKNEGAYAQVTFHVFTKTINNQLDPKLPLLTYSSPAGEYGAEPILLDFHLTNAPLHIIAAEDSEDEIPDWRIQATINGETFVLAQWQPIYLKGWQRGKNWVQLKFIDEQGNVVENIYNNTAKVFTYKPGGKDTLSRLVRGELSVAAAKGIINPTYEAPPTPAPTPTPEPVSEEKPTPIPPVTPTPETSSQEEISPTATPLPESAVPDARSIDIPTPEKTITPSETATPEIPDLEAPVLTPEETSPEPESALTAEELIEELTEN